jgi:hypothetical protein
MIFQEKVFTFLLKLTIIIFLKCNHKNRKETKEFWLLVITHFKWQFLVK